MEIQGTFCKKSHFEAILNTWVFEVIELKFEVSFDLKVNDSRKDEGGRDSVNILQMKSF